MAVVDKKEDNELDQFSSTRNACKVCSPLGASVAFKGIEGCVPLIHGSQGCSTYIRRYMISHFKEPVDIASSNFTQDSAIFGGNKNFFKSIENITKQYNPEIIGIASTCLSETIGEDVPKMISEYKATHKSDTIPELVYVSTPSYNGTHIDGFHETVAALVEAFAQGGVRGEHINILPGFISPEDLRYLKEILSDFFLEYILVPDYSETLDGGTWEEYMPIAPGGTSLKSIKSMGTALATLEFGSIFNSGKTKKTINSSSASEYLNKRFKVECLQTTMPLGIKATDKFFEIIEELSLTSTPDKYIKERERLIDAYIDGHKYIFGKRAIIYGEEDFLVGLASFLKETGIEIILALSGGESGMLKDKLEEVTGAEIDTIEGGDFESMAEIARELKPDILIGNSKGYYIARELKIPLVRVGFPIHDRMGGQRTLHIGYRGAQQLYDTIVNTIIQQKQDLSPVGYNYM